MGEAQSRIKHLEAEVARLNRLVEILAGQMLNLIKGREDKCDFALVLNIHEGLEGRL